MDNEIDTKKQEMFIQTMRYKHPSCKFKFETTSYQGKYYNKVLYCIIDDVRLVATINSRETREYTRPLLLSMKGRDFIELKVRCEMGDFRIAPEAKIIPMEILINSGIDCEFWDDRGQDKRIGQLMELADDEWGFVDRNANSFRNCRPRMSHWMSWDACAYKINKHFTKWLDEYFEWGEGVNGFFITCVKEGYRFAWESDK